MGGFSVPVFVTGVLLIVIFSVLIPNDSMFWLPSINDTTLQVTDWASFVKQVKQMAMPVFVLALFNAAQISRDMRASMLDNLSQDDVRTARAKGLIERVVLAQTRAAQFDDPGGDCDCVRRAGRVSGAIISENAFKLRASW
jgi:peptide/nickel transport system permease protein